MDPLPVSEKPPEASANEDGSGGRPAGGSEARRKSGGRVSVGEDGDDDDDEEEVLDVTSGGENRRPTGSKALAGKVPRSTAVVAGGTGTGGKMGSCVKNAETKRIPKVGGRGGDACKCGVLFCSPSMRPLRCSR